jgi:hypothetical protein
MANSTILTIESFAFVAVGPVVCRRAVAPLRKRSQGSTYAGLSVTPNRPDTGTRKTTLRVYTSLSASFYGIRR